MRYCKIFSQAVVIISLAFTQQIMAADAITVNATDIQLNKDVTITGQTNVSGALVAASLAAGAGQSINEISADGTLSDNSDSAVPTEKAVKTYVDAAIAGASSGGGFSTGDIKATMATGEPAGWLFMNGQAVSRTGDTADLFALFGTSYGSGDGSTTFNLPDARGRVLAAVDNLGGVSANVVADSAADSIGGQQGAETHALTVAEMPAHSHGMDSAGAHSHSFNIGSDDGESPDGFDKQNESDGTFNTNTAGDHTHNIHNTGGGQAHNNMQPTMFVNYLIKK